MSILAKKRLILETCDLSRISYDFVLIKNELFKRFEHKQENFESVALLESLKSKETLLVPLALRAIYLFSKL